MKALRHFRKKQIKTIRCTKCLCLAALAYIGWNFEMSNLAIFESIKKMLHYFTFAVVSATFVKLLSL